VSDPVIVALISGACLVLASIGVEMIRTSRRAQRTASAAEAKAGDAVAAIGTPNGHGNVVQMMEKLLAGQTGQDGRLARLEDWHAEKIEKLGHISDRLDRLDEGAKHSHRQLEHLGDKALEHTDALHELERRLAALESPLTPDELGLLRRVQMLRRLGLDVAAIQPDDEEGGS
jgi:hypothetical protein